MLFNQITFLFAPHTAIYTPHSRNANSFFFFFFFLPFILCGCLCFVSHAAASYCCYYFYCYTSLLLCCSFHQNTISAEIEIQQIHEKKSQFFPAHRFYSRCTKRFFRAIYMVHVVHDSTTSCVVLVVCTHHGKLKWAKYFGIFFAPLLAMNRSLLCCFFHFFFVLWATIISLKSFLVLLQFVSLSIAISFALAFLAPPKKTNFWPFCRWIAWDIQTNNVN